MPIATLLVQSGCMFAASFIVGSLPLWFKSATSGQRLQIVSVLGMGLLVGAALTIIIPEGVSTLYAALPQDGHDGNESAIHATGVSLLAGFSLMLLIESLIPHPPSPPPQATDFTYESPPSSPASSEPTPRPSAQHLNSSTPMISKPKRMSVDDSASEGAATVSAVHGLNATLGLVIHGAADGIALGASSLASSNSSLGLVVFLAVLIHKGPTALGLTTTLLSLSLPLSSIRRRLMIFSCAAPAGAIATFLLVSAFGSRSLGGSRNGGDPLGWWTGIALLFSVDTLYDTQPFNADDPIGRIFSLCRYRHTTHILGYRLPCPQPQPSPSRKRAWPRTVSRRPYTGQVPTDSTVDGRDDPASVFEFVCRALAFIGR
ncbi:hypothetical protein L202_04282 [Cryptococcus amylolentus CBS 6039]|uniref:Solute carrier family 39 (Zinc transporter), member 9 n=1 Tax=Cryptococcus amylolentus CBS 6039 TaxID=1295533 RepID=A0A1E3HQR5_9TREE|nr:hypothetical protein L202_04282 [Cryptococcus amylolentus CBS 6039]ODN78710.1 hypothetical protein L202_04282 [Cryptococcus amylolentus CBS 6039]